MTAKFAYYTDAELVDAARDCSVEKLDREGLLDLVVELSNALDDRLHYQGLRWPAFVREAK